MKLFLRLFWLFITQSRRSRCSFLGPCDTALRVFPNDLDVFLHVNNGVYLTFLDLARTDMMLRSGMSKLIRDREWYPVVASETIRFRRSLRVFQRFSVTTKVVAWNEKSIFIEHLITRGDSVIAEAVLDARFLARAGGSVSSAMVMDALGMDMPSPTMPEWIRQWQSATVGMSAAHDRVR